MQAKALENLAGEASAVVRRAGAFILEQVGKVKARDIEDKARNSLVSYVDKQAEEMLVDGLSRLLPEAAFLTEEDTVENTEAELRWIIDPLDGTTNFLHGLPVFSVSVGLEVKGDLLLGLVYELGRDEFFSAYHGGGAWLNGRSIQVSPNERAEHSLVATGFPYEMMDHSGPLMDTFATFMQESRGGRRLGSAAVDLAYVAAGRFDLFYEPALNPWDVAGGAVLVREAGGLVTDFHGGEGFLFNGAILACTAPLQDWALRIIQQKLLSESS